MATTPNGWEVIHSRADRRLSTGTIPGTRVRITAHNAALPLLLALAAEVHTRVHSLTANNEQGQDEAGYTYRNIGGQKVWSNHASGSAIDLNWRLWPMFSKRMTRKQRSAARAVTLDFSPVLAWGGEWKRVDEMHWEIRKGVTPEQARAWARKHIGPDGRLKK